MLWSLVVQENFHVIVHNISCNGRSCRWTILARGKVCSSSDSTRENYEWKVPKLARTVIVKWCRENAERCIAISIKLKNMRVYRLLKASTLASRAPLHSCAGSRGLSSIGFISRLFGASPSEPIPKKDPSYQTVHGVELQDDFHWLKNRESKVSLTEKFPSRKFMISHAVASPLPRRPLPFTIHGLTSFLKVIHYWHFLGDCVRFALCLLHALWLCSNNIELIFLPSREGWESESACLT